MVLSEQVRQIGNESSLIDDSTSYSQNNASWATLKNYGNITLSNAALIVWRFNIQTSGVGYRLKIGSYYVWGKYVSGATDTGYYMGIAYMAAGTHAIVVECKGNGQIRFFTLGTAKFSDETGQTARTYSSSLSVTVANRTTCIGALKNAVFVVHCFGKTTGGQTNFENVGDNLTNGVSMTVDSVQVNWTERNQDTGNNETSSASYYGVLSVGSAHTFALTKRNVNTQVDITVYACPWILTASSYEPVTMDFSQGSTIYFMLEPLSGDITKFIGVGKKRAVSYGNSTDYYSTSSGTGLLSFSYTFENVAPNSTPLYVNGFLATDPDLSPYGGCGCVGFIGVDMR
jgi:hypothetical protein